MTPKRLLMLAVDAGDIFFIRDNLDELPTFRRLLDEGELLPLDSTAEYASASIWPSFYTGQGPGEHGVTQHIQWDPSTMRMRRLASNWFRCDPFWLELERGGLDVCVVDVPFTYPSRLRAGVEISNWGSHDLMGGFAANPASLRREIRRRFGRHPMGYEIPVNKSRAEVRMLHDQVVRGARRKGALLGWLTDRVEWDFFLGVFGECHRAGHILWPEPGDPETVVPAGALLDVYREVDAGIASVLDKVDIRETSVVVFSLHGMRSNFSQEHFVRRVMDRINQRFQSPFEDARREHPVAAPTPSASPQRGLIRTLRESLPARLQFTIARSVPVSVRDWVVGREVTGGIDWSRTPGIALRSDVHSFIRFNIAGRERDGMLEDGSPEHRRYRDWVVQSFLALRECGSDEPLVADVVAAQDVLSGERSSLLPDLIVRWANRPRARRIYAPELGELEAEPETGRTGEHRSQGFAILYGRDLHRQALPELSHNTHFPDFVRALLGQAEAQ